MVTGLLLRRSDGAPRKRRNTRRRDQDRDDRRVGDLPGREEPRRQRRSPAFDAGRRRYVVDIWAVAPAVLKSRLSAIALKLVPAATWPSSVPSVTESIGWPIGSSLPHRREGAATDPAAFGLDILGRAREYRRLESLDRPPLMRKAEPAASAQVGRATRIGRSRTSPGTVHTSRRRRLRRPAGVITLLEQVRRRGNSRGLGLAEEVPATWLVYLGDHVARALGQAKKEFVVAFALDSLLSRRASRRAGEGRPPVDQG